MTADRKAVLAEAAFSNTAAALGHSNSQMQNIARSWPEKFNKREALHGKLRSAIRGQK